MKESPNWQELPDELISNILKRLRTVYILKSARKVCRTWRRLCKDPAMWKVIDMHKSPHDSDTHNTNYDLEMLTKEAVELSHGELIDIRMDCFGSDDLLQHIVRRSSNLRRLCLRSCYNITGNGLIQAVKRVPKLEELGLSFMSISVNDIGVIGRNCGLLKSFTMDKVFRGPFIKSDDLALAIANSMPELRHLEVFDREMTNDGLEAILNGCPHLQSLDVRMCYNLDLDGILGNLCMERIKDFKHDQRF